MTGGFSAAGRIGVIVFADGADWETDVLPALERAGHAVVKRCVDVTDLMAASTLGSAAVAVVSGDAHGLDGEAVVHLLRHDVRTVAVLGDAVPADRLGRLGVLATVPGSADAVVAGVAAALAADVVADPQPNDEVLVAAPEREPGRVIAVWGPAGAPGRTTIATGLAATHAASGGTSILVDADPYGGAVAQQLGILDEVSGLLAAARLANSGALESDAFARCARRVGDRFSVLTGLPRADRRVEVRPGVLERILEVAGEFGDVVVDTGFCIEEDPVGIGRDRLTLDALAAADEVVVVGSAEPTGLARLARGLVEVSALVPGPVHVVVNRMRPSLGWSERDIAGMVEGYVRPAGLHFLPEDRVGVDKALVAGRAISELGDTPLVAAIRGLAAAVTGASVQAPNQAPNSR